MKKYLVGLACVLVFGVVSADEVQYLDTPDGSGPTGGFVETDPEALKAAEEYKKMHQQANDGTLPHGDWRDSYKSSTGSSSSSRPAITQADLDKKIKSANVNSGGEIQVTDPATGEISLKKVEDLQSGDYVSGVGMVTVQGDNVTLVPVAPSPSEAVSPISPENVSPAPSGEEGEASAADTQKVPSGEGAAVATGEESGKTGTSTNLAGEGEGGFLETGARLGDEAQFDSETLFPTWPGIGDMEGDNKKLIGGVVGMNQDGPEGEEKLLAVFIPRLVDILMKFVAPILAVTLIFTGLRFLYAGQDQELLEKCKRHFMMLIIGLVLILVSYSLVKGLYYLFSV